MRECKFAQRQKDALTVHAPEGDEPRDVFVYDPEVPVLAPGGPQALSGPHRSGRVSRWATILLVYTSNPVKHETEIFGQPRNRLYAATSAPQADFTAKLVRVTRTAERNSSASASRAVHGCSAHGIHGR